MAALCPECDSPLDMEDDLDQGDAVQCEECGAKLEVVAIDPIELASVEDSGYDDEDLSPLSTDDDE